ncbi:MAG TPA: hypothetical protein VNA13_02140, partial [Xanthomonadales bacterium]|nr:hypothetical protein [Xanthomonadales bacterium]
ISKERDPRMWKKWEQSGATETFEGGVLRGYSRILNDSGGLPIEAHALHFAGPAKGNSVIGVGREIINEGPRWSVSRPIFSVVSPGHEYSLGQRIKKLPDGTRTLKSVFGKR